MNKNLLMSLAVLMVSALILVLTLRGLPGNPAIGKANSEKWIQNGPFSLSPERGRYALTYALAENGSLNFSAKLAEFAMPDVGFHNGRYVSLFVPGVSFVALPGYLLGKTVGLAQLGTFAMVSLVALVNVYLIMRLATALGVPKAMGWLAGIVFLFATPAFSYAVSLYQHHFSTFVLLASVNLLLNKPGFTKSALIWFLYGLSAFLDYPNLILLLPVAIYHLWQTVGRNWHKGYLTLKVPVVRILAVAVIAIPLAAFLFYNRLAYGNSYQLAGTVRTPKDLAKNNPEYKKQAVRFFHTRNMMNGFYIHLLSPDRGVVVFAPVMILGAWGLVQSLRKKQKLSTVILAVVSTNLVLYALWGDPWGGWAFGSRYLIPSYALLSVSLIRFLSDYRPSKSVMAIAIVFIIYSLGVNTLGAVTTSSMPPKVEAIPLAQTTNTVQKYTYERNLDYLRSGFSLSFVYRNMANNYLSLTGYYLLISGLTMALSLGLLYSGSQKRGEK